MFVSLSDERLDHVKARSATVSVRLRFLRILKVHNESDGQYWSDIIVVYPRYQGNFLRIIERLGDSMSGRNGRGSPPEMAEHFLTGKAAALSTAL